MQVAGIAGAVVNLAKFSCDTLMHMSIRLGLIMEMSPAGLCLQNFRNFVGVGVGCVTLEVAENGENGVAYSDFGHAVRAAGRGEDLLAGGVGHRYSFPGRSSSRNYRLEQS